MLTNQEKIIYASLLLEKRRRQLEKSLYLYTKDAFETLNPSDKFIDNWHIKYLCDKTQEKVEKHIAGEPVKSMIINVSPRSLKSFIFSVCLPSWSWIHKPALKFIGSSYSSDLSTELNILNRRLLLTPNFYKRYWNEKIKFVGDQNLKTFFENDKTGFRRCTSTGGTITGSGADIILMDDPQNPKLAASETSRKTAINFFDHTLSTRLNNPETGFFILVMQRLHELDLTGHILSKEADRWDYICIPGELSDDIRPIEIKKYYQNDLFFPKRFTKDFLASIKISLGSQQYANQIMQRASPEEGGILKRKWWRTYEELPKLDFRIISIDATFEGNEKNDYVVMQEWGKKKIDKFLISQWRGKWDFNKTLEIIRKIHNDCLLRRIVINGWYIEAKANGPAIMSAIKEVIPGVLPINPQGSKYARAMATQPQLEAGNIHVPNPKTYNWVDDFIEECANFPNAKHDDQVDAYSQAALVLDEKSGALSAFDMLCKF